MKTPTTAAELKVLRLTVGLSQAALGRLSGVSRWKLNAYEFGDLELSPEEMVKIRAALKAEVDRMQRVAASVSQPATAA